MHADSGSYLHSGRSTPRSSVMMSSAYGTSARSAAEPAAASARIGGGHARQTSEQYDEDGFLLDSAQPSRRVCLFLEPLVTCHLPKAVPLVVLHACKLCVSLSSSQSQALSEKEWGSARTGLPYV